MLVSELGVHVKKVIGSETVRRGTASDNEAVELPAMGKEFL